MNRAHKRLRYYFHTVRHLLPRQVAGRLWHSVYRPQLPRDGRPTRRRAAGVLQPGRLRTPSMLQADWVTVLNKRGRVAMARDWNDPRQDKLWLYNLHYFDDLNARGAEARVSWHRNLIARWIAENPPTAGNGWEPYPISLRAVNWIKWDLRIGALDEAAQASLALQIRWLRRRLEYHLLGNHLLANAKALIYGGLYFEGAEADEWLRMGRSIFDEQLKEQVLPDGGHFELSPMYHLIVVEDVLDVINVFQAYEQSVPGTWLDAASRMLKWARVMQHPDGDIPFFNDAAFGIAGTSAELHEYAERLFDKVSERGLSRTGCVGNVRLPDSGYVRLEERDAVLFFDVAPLGPDYLPGHGHADTLSLELSLFGQRVLVNSGTSLYSTGAERQRQRSTDAHNTIMIDGEDSSEVWGGFRVARRARAQVLRFSPDEGVVEAQHDGYGRLANGLVHRRQVRLTDGALSVVDVVEGAFSKRGEWCVQGAWHLHPSVGVEQGTGVSHSADGHCYRFVVPTEAGSRTLNMLIQGAAHVWIEASTWHPEFGLRVPSHRIVFRQTEQIPVTIATHIRWSHEDEK